MSWLVHLTWKQKAFNTQHIESRANDRAYKRRTVTSIAKAQWRGSAAAEQSEAKPFAATAG